MHRTGWPDDLFAKDAYHRQQAADRHQHNVFRPGIDANPTLLRSQTKDSQARRNAESVNQCPTGPLYQRRRKALIFHTEFALGGVPIGAERDPTQNEILCGSSRRCGLSEVGSHFGAY